MVARMWKSIQRPGARGRRRPRLTQFHNRTTLWPGSAGRPRLGRSGASWRASDGRGRHLLAQVRASMWKWISRIVSPSKRDQALETTRTRLPDGWIGPAGVSSGPCGSPPTRFAGRGVAVGRGGLDRDGEVGESRFRALGDLQVGVALSARRPVPFSAYDRSGAISVLTRSQSASLSALMNSPATCAMSVPVNGIVISLRLGCSDPTPVAGSQQRRWVVDRCRAGRRRLPLSRATSLSRTTGCEASTNLRKSVTIGPATGRPAPVGAEADAIPQSRASHRKKTAAAGAGWEAART